MESGFALRRMPEMPWADEANAVNVGRRLYLRALDDDDPLDDVKRWLGSELTPPASGNAADR
jgi:hypothetical protein